MRHCATHTSTLGVILFLLLVSMVTASVRAQSPPRSENVDQATMDRALSNLKDRQAADASATTRRSPTSRPTVPQRPSDMDVDTWRELQAYLQKERPIIARNLEDYRKSIQYAKKRIEAAKRDKRISDESRNSAIQSDERSISEYEKRIDDLQKGRTVPFFRGPELDVQRLRLKQIGCVGKGKGNPNQIGIVFAGETTGAEGRPAIEIQWQRWEEYTTKMDRVFSPAYLHDPSENDVMPGAI